MKKTTALLIILLLTGCSHSRYNMETNGLYYEANKADCPIRKIDNDGKLLCYDKENQYLGLRHPVPMDIVQDQRHIEQRQAEAVTNSINQTSATLAYQNRYRYRRY